MSKKKALPVFKYTKSIKRALVVVTHPDDVDFGLVKFELVLSDFELVLFTLTIRSIKF